MVTGIDTVFSQSESWYDSMAISRPPKDKPWYNVLVDRSLYLTYVAERNLITSQDRRQVDHPFLGHYFDKYDGSRYYLKKST